MKAKKIKALQKQILKLQSKFFLLVALSFSISCLATPTEREAVPIIIGEAANQGIIGMEGVARVIRNRGSPQGFCGRKAKHIAKQPDWVWHDARKAWRLSASRDITGGATHFENVRAFGEPYWAESMKRTVKIRDHQFYRK